MSVLIRGCSKEADDAVLSRGGGCNLAKCASKRRQERLRWSAGRSIQYHGSAYAYALIDSPRNSAAIVKLGSRMGLQQR